MGGLRDARVFAPSPPPTTANARLETCNTNLSRRQPARHGRLRGTRPRKGCPVLQTAAELFQWTKTLFSLVCSHNSTCHHQPRHAQHNYDHDGNATCNACCFFCCREFGGGLPPRVRVRVSQLRRHGLGGALNLDQVQLEDQDGAGGDEFTALAVAVGEFWGRQRQARMQGGGEETEAKNVQKRKSVG